MRRFIRVIVELGIQSQHQTMIDIKKYSHFTKRKTRKLVDFENNFKFFLYTTTTTAIIGFTFLNTYISIISAFIVEFLFKSETCFEILQSTEERLARLYGSTRLLTALSFIESERNVTNTLFV